jgi:hypothetical protein
VKPSLLFELRCENEEAACLLGEVVQSEAGTHLNMKVRSRVWLDEHRSKRQKHSMSSFPINGSEIVPWGCKHNDTGEILGDHHLQEIRDRVQAIRGGNTSDRTPYIVINHHGGPIG